MKKIISFLIVLFVIMNSTIVFGMDFSSNNSYNMTYKSILNLSECPNTHPYSFYDYGFGFCDDVNPIMSYLNKDGTYSICVNIMDKDISIYELNTDNTVNMSFSVKREASSLGAFTKDGEGNYYLLFGRDDDITAYTLVKYDSSGIQSGKIEISIKESDTATPFNGGTCSIAESNGILAVHDGRLIDSAHVTITDTSTGKGFESSFRHQGSCLFMIDTASMELITMNKNVASHSFNQDVIIDDDNFIFVDRGDASPRGFLISKYNKNGKLLGQISPFSFKGDLDWDEYGQGTSDGNTYSQYGGIIALKDRYVICGTYENTSSSLDFSPRNVFIQFIDKDMENFSEPIYITNYKLQNDGENINVDAANPKIINAEKDNFIVLYDEYVKGKTIDRNTSGWSSSDKMLKIPQKTQLVLFNTDGKIIQSKEINNIAETGLPYVNDVVYNKQSDTLDWFGNKSSLLIKYSIGINDPTAYEKTHLTVSDFSDTASLDQYKIKALNDMLQMGVLSGYNDNTIRPYANVTKAEYVCMLVRFLKLPTKETSLSFTNVPNSHWAYKEISTALSEGIIEKNGDLFNPNEKITLGEAVKMLFKAKGYDTDIDKYPVGLFEERLINAYGKEYYKYLAIAYDTNFIDSSQFSIFGDKNEEPFITRAETAVMFRKTLAIQKIYISETNFGNMLVQENTDGTSSMTIF